MAGVQPLLLGEEECKALRERALALGLIREVHGETIEFDSILRERWYQQPQ
jgi:hypothetical protein